MKRLMLGNEAVARGLYEAGCRVVSSYPGTPSTEISEYAAKYEEIYAEWAPNEKVAAEVALGASFGGARSFCAMKHVGLNVAADPLFLRSAEILSKRLTKFLKSMIHRYCFGSRPVCLIPKVSLKKVSEKKCP